ncbi:ribosome hibernation factor-recruiting GTPase MRF [Blastococcus sp. KM273129]|uniref:ribosome hibernation factor-recruiting GTPase MRF n=1 Tax=Blastococcus sp. KM273129 TaxID=2570315 RepID=UPI001F1B335E|nr:GTP-binding protein [Blastococcus sp. KM273129]MCF6737554.1 cobalamin biosynthesis protein CobW [Blastococcus sp. KM273129]
MTSSRTPLVIVTGLEAAHTGRASRALLGRAGSVVVHHDVRQLGHGVVLRTVTRHTATGLVEERTAVELAHGCLSCTLRLDLLPLLHALGAEPDVVRIVLQLDPALEPENLCWSIDHLVLDHVPAGPDGTAADRVEVAGVLAVVDGRTWLEDVTGAEELADRGLAATPDDDRTLAQVGLGQVAFADAVLLAGGPVDAWTAARLDAVLDRLVSGVPRADAAVGPERLLAALGPGARRGRLSSVHDPLLPGRPPLGEDVGVSVIRFSAPRPFHPDRLHEALDVLLEGVVCSRGRVWLASQHDRALWMESAGQGLRMGDAGPWLATLPDDSPDWADVEPERQVAAALRWDPAHGDRHTEVVVLSHRQPGVAVISALDAALLTDDEMAAGPAAWAGLPDPFGSWHEDPCEATPAPDDRASTTDREDRS